MLKLTTDKHEASRGGVEILLYLPTVIMYTDSRVNKPNLLFPHYYFPHGIIMPRIFISRIFSVSGECGRYPTPCKEGENCPGNCLGDMSREKIFGSEPSERLSNCADDD